MAHWECSYQRAELDNFMEFYACFFGVISDLRRQDDVRSILLISRWLISPFFLQTPTIVENLKQKLARNFICIKGQRSLNEYTMEYTKLRQAAEGWWKQIFFFALLPSKISWWNCCTNMLMSIRQRVQCPKVRSYVLISCMEFPLMAACSQHSTVTT